MESKLNIQITVTDEQMEQLIRGNLERLPDEKLQEIFSNALVEFLKTPNGQKLFYSQPYYDSNPVPTKLLVQMVENAVSRDLLKPCVDEFIEKIKGNYDNLIRETMIQTFSNMFFTQIQQTTLQCQLTKILNDVESMNNRT